MKMCPIGYKIFHNNNQFLKKNSEDLQNQPKHWHSVKSGHTKSNWGLYNVLHGVVVGDDQPDKVFDHT